MTETGVQSPKRCHEDCANFRVGQGVCLEWRRHVGPEDPICSRFLAAIGPRNEATDFKSMLHREIPPKKPVTIPRLKPTGVVLAKETKREEKEEVAVGHVGVKSKADTETVKSDQVLRDEILDKLLNHGMTQTAIAEELGEPLWRVSKLVVGAVNEGIIRRVEQGKYEWLQEEQADPEPDGRPAKPELIEEGQAPIHEEAAYNCKVDKLAELEKRIAQFEQRNDQVQVMIGELDTRITTRLNTMVELLGRADNQVRGHDDQLEVLSTQIKHLADQIGKLWARTNDETIKSTLRQAEIINISRPRLDSEITLRLLSILECQLAILAESRGLLIERGGAA